MGASLEALVVFLHGQIAQCQASQCLVVLLIDVGIAAAVANTATGVAKGCRITKAVIIGAAAAAPLSMAQLVPCTVTPIGQVDGTLFSTKGLHA